MLQTLLDAGRILLVMTAKPRDFHKEQAVMVGDRMFDIKGAGEAGIHSSGD